MVSNKDFNHPVVGADQTIQRANLYRDSYYQFHKFWRERSDLALGLLVAATFAVPLIGKSVFQGERANFRPWYELAGYTAIAVSAISLTDSLRFSKEGEVGSSVLAEVRINASEDLIEQQSERKFHPYGSPNGTTETVALEAEQIPPEPSIENLGDTASKSKLPLLVVGSTGAGKTTLLEAILKGIHDNYPEAEVTFFDGKPTGDRGLLGIKNTRHYISVGQISEIPQFYAEMDKYGHQLMASSRGSNSRKSFAITDEINNAVTKAKKFGLEEKAKDPKLQDKTNYAALIPIANNLLISQGREKGCIGISTTHEATVEALGQGSGMRENNRFIILGSKDAFGNVESILSGTGARLITNLDTLERLKQQYQHHKDLLFRGYFALTNVGGDWRLIRLPDWSNGFPDCFKAAETPEISENPFGNFSDDFDTVSEDGKPETVDYESDSDGYAYKVSGVSAVSTIKIDPQNGLIGDLSDTTEISEIAETEITSELTNAITQAIADGLGKTAIVKTVIQADDRYMKLAASFTGNPYQRAAALYDDTLSRLVVQN